MLLCSEREGSLYLTVRVVPRASRSEIRGTHEGALRIRLAAPPVDGAANAELIKTLAVAFQVPPRNVAIVRGHTAKLKYICISGATVVHAEKLAQEQFKLI